MGDVRCLDERSLMRVLAILIVVGVAATASGAPGQRGAADGPDTARSSTNQADQSAEARALLDRYCVTCHNQRLRTAGLTFDTMNVGLVSDGAEVWEKVVRKVRLNAMPPPGRPRPDQRALDSFAAYLETSLDRAAALRPNPGRTEALHRLNRTEYQNAIRDLFGLEIDVASMLPADEADRHGFDNMAGVLSVSPALLDRYVTAANKISRLAVGLPPTGPVIEAYQIPLNLQQDDRLSEELPFGSRGGTAIRHQFPVDGEYLIKVRLQTNYVDYIRGLDEAHEIEVRLDGRRVQRFRVGGQAPGNPAPASYEGNIFGEPAWERYMHEADAGLEVRLRVRAGSHVVGVTFPREFWEPDGVLQPRQSGFALAINAVPEGNPAVGSVTISGPYGVAGSGTTASRRRIFVCRPGGGADETTCAQTILTALARRAYRRPPTGREVDALLAFHRMGRAEGSFDAGIQAGIERLLVDPSFLFRVERDPPKAAAGTAYRLTDFELASRLSFFLWSSIPDDELLDLAARGKLRNEKTLEGQVRRLLADDRSKALTENFVGQWLHLRNIRTVYPDPDVFPEFDENLREALQRETELFFESQLREDKSVVELLSANYTFLNERLARHYGIPNVYGNRFRRVTLSDPRRGGLLGQGSLLTVTSYPNRTSPVLRGKWLLENIVGNPPPPPPPDVPALPDRGEGGKLASVRERLEHHRRNPACSVCHAPMDPLGFALENFDAIGGWRTTEAGAAIDASGALPSGAKFEGPAGLREVLLDQREQFVRTVTEKLLMYALGRGVEHYDLPTIRAITRDAARNDYRWSSVILGIVRSLPFQMRRSKEQP
jgi:mono/diheme cytochrome c family protein